MGDRLHAGGLPILSPDGWMAGNWTVEGQNSLWNPVQLALYYVAPMVDRLDLLAAGAKGCFAVVLALGVYRVALAYGARPGWAAVVGAAMPGDRGLGSPLQRSLRCRWPRRCAAW